MITWTDYDIGNHRITCPACGRGERDRTLGVTIEHDGAGVAHCHRCHFVENYRPDRGARITTQSKPRIKAATPPAKHDTLSDYGRELWAASKPLSGVALDYLNARRCRIPPADGDIRYHPALKHPTGYVGPALVARITDAVTGEALSLHRTWIRADGRKADVEPPRLLLAGHRKQGGVIRLWPDEAVTQGLGIAEGIESALSLAWAHEPTWSVIDAGNMAAFPVLPGIEVLTIAADNDVAGQNAADECGIRWANADCEVYIVTPKKQSDINDAVQEGV